MKHDLFALAGWALLIFLFGVLIVMGGCGPGSLKPDPPTSFETGLGDQ